MDVKEATETIPYVATLMECPNEGEESDKIARTPPEAETPQEGNGQGKNHS